VNDIGPTVLQAVTSMPQMLFMRVDTLAGVRAPNLRGPDRRPMLKRTRSTASRVVGSRSRKHARRSAACLMHSSAWRCFRRPPKSSTKSCGSRTAV
jgi:hypothetical protein